MLAVAGGILLVILALALLPLLLSAVGSLFRVGTNLIGIALVFCAVALPISGVLALASQISPARGVPVLLFAIIAALFGFIVWETAQDNNK